jgi:hypothetical protein
MKINGNVVDLSGYSVEELERLSASVDVVIERKQKERLIEAVNNAVRDAQRKGISINDLILGLMRHHFRMIERARKWLSIPNVRREFEQLRLQ